MFQTDIIHFIQGFKSEESTFLMTLFTSIGNREFFLIVLAAIMFGINFKKGFLLTQITIFTTLVTEMAKDFFALPRPWFVDSTLDFFDKEYLRSESINSGGANRFFGMLPVESINAYRELRPDSYGFPSGHTSSAISFWYSLILLFRKKWIIVIGIIAMIMVPFSRLYLGRHFLADVLGGYLIGFLLLFLFYSIVFRPKPFEKYFNLSRIILPNNLKGSAVAFYLFALPVLFAFFVESDFTELTGNWLGINLAYYLTGLMGFVQDNRRISVRIFRVLLALINLFLIGYLLKLLMTNIAADVPGVILFIKGCFITFFGISGTIVICKKIKFY